MATPTQAVFDPTAPYQSASPQTAPQPAAASQTAPAPAQKPAFDPNASYEPAPLPGMNVDKQWEPSPGDPLVRVRTSDGKNWELHQHDLEKLKQRDPGVKVFESYVHTPKEDARSRTFQNMTSAMSGQPMQNPEDQAEAEKGRKAGTIAGGIQLATGAAGGLFAPGVQVAQETSSILGPEGEPVVKEVLKKTPSVAAKTASTVVDTAQTIAKWTKENPIKAVAVEALAREMGVDPFQLLGKVIKYGKNLFQ